MFSSGVNLGQEFFIKSDTLEDKVRKILPSQGGLGQGFDLSASTQIIPIVDLTESAEGSELRQDLQRSFSFSSITSHNVNNTTSTLVNNTGYYRVFGNVYITGGGFGYINLTDGFSTKILLRVNADSADQVGNEYFDFVVYLTAGDSLTAQSNSTNVTVSCVTRQLADVDGTLVNP